MWASVLLGGAVAALLSLAAAEPARRGLFDSWQRLAPRPVAAREVAVVLVDPISLRTVGPWPWPRYYLARLTETIAAQHPRAIAFDMLFPEGDRLNPDQFAALYPELDARAAASIGALPSMDAIFAQVLGGAPVVLGRLGMDGNGNDPATLLLDPEMEGRPPPGTVRYGQVLPSIAPLDDVALGHALLNGTPDADGIIRHVPLAAMAGMRAMPGLAAELARMATDAPRIAWHGREAAIGALRVPADDTGAMQLRFGHFPDAARHSAALVLSDRLKPGTFTGKVVIVGLGAEGISDVVSTPTDPEGYGVFVQAQAVDAILHHGWLARPPWIAAGEWLAGALLVMATGLAGLARRRWPWLVAGGLVLMLPALSWLLFAGPGLLFDPVRPAMIGLGAMLALGVLLFVRGRTERARLARELFDQQLGAAAQEGELAAARQIQLGMVPAPALLARLDPRIDAGAALEPARSVGGDFYDAIRIDEARVLFVIGDVTGKGVPAALYMALSKTLAKSVLVREAGGLAHAAATLNRELLREADEAMGVTMLIVLFDCASGEATMVNAGHENPILLRPGHPPESVPMRGGPPFCVCDFAYPEERLVLSPGETLVLVTDGVTEAFDAQDRLFGLEGTFATLAGVDGSAGAAPLVEALVSAVRLFEHPTEPTDDLTVLALRWRGAGAA